MAGIDKKRYFRNLLNLKNYKVGSNLEQLKKELSKVYFGDQSHAQRFYLLGNGRTSIYLYLKALKLSTDSNIVIQGFTCNAVTNPILWLGLEPRYVDINIEDYSFSLAELKKKVDEKTKVIILQHTFGIPGPIDEVLKFAHAKGILVIEDTAHAFGMKNDSGKVLGTFGDASLISFGIDKVLGTRVGGALLLNNTDIETAVAKEYEKFKYISLFDSYIWLLNPFLWKFISKFKGLRRRVGQFITSLGLLNMGFYRSEYIGVMPKKYPKRLTNNLADFALSEISIVENNLKHRREIVRYYNRYLAGLKPITQAGNQGKVIPMVKYPILLRSKMERDMLHDRLYNKGILVSKWYDPVVFPEGEGLAPMRYTIGTCPNGEFASSRILALPTGFNVDEDDVKMIADEVAKLSGNIV